MDFNIVLTNAIDIIVAVGLKVIGAIIFWFVGRWLIGVATRLLREAQINKAPVNWGQQ